MAKRKRSVIASQANELENDPPVTLGKAASVKAEQQEDVGTILDAANSEKPAVKKPKTVKRPADDKDEQQLLPRGDPEAEDRDEDADPADIHAASLRPPPVNSDYLPLPWKGRLGYACLNTYLRNSVPPVFSSRTTRIASILEHRHPLKDPSLPGHATKNRPDKDQPAELRRGQQFIEQLCIANVRDMVKMIRWNDRYGIKFMRLSSEAFPFASHGEYGYKLAPFAAKELAKVGKVAAELGHRLTTHPGQFTQLGSPRDTVIENAIRDLEYHEEMLSLLKLPAQQDRDAVMILHMGGMFGDKEATLNRFRHNYARLSDAVKKRLVLENDDVIWSVHDLLPVCQELNIPFVLDFHHNNIVFDADKIREGTKDIMEMYPAILQTWRRKSITPKMHYSEPTPPAITGRQRRKHNPRPATLPPCPDNMDLMIEAKDKEQAVFELMRTFRLPGWDTFNNIVPHVRDDINRPAGPKKATPKKTSKQAQQGGEDEKEAGEDAIVGAEAGRIDLEEEKVVSAEDVGMGGPLGRVYWPPGMEEWLRPVKRVIKKKEPEGSGTLTAAQKKIVIAEAKAELAAEMKAKKAGSANGVADPSEAPAIDGQGVDAPAAPAPAPAKKRGGRVAVKGIPKVTDGEAEKVLAQAEEEVKSSAGGRPGARSGARASRVPRRSYREVDNEEGDDED